MGCASLRFVLGCRGGYSGQFLFFGELQTTVQSKVVRIVETCGAGWTGPGLGSI